MSNREKCIAILDGLTDTQLESIAAILQAAKDAIIEAEDNAFCAKLYQDYLNDPDPRKHDTVAIEDLAKELGVTLP
jgi:hypothetical protein